MGAAVGQAVPEKFIELRLAPAEIQIPTGQNGQPCECAAQVEVLGQSNSTQHVRWNEPVWLALSDDTAVISVTMFAIDVEAGQHMFLAETCLPFRCLCRLGLTPGGAAIPLRLSLLTGIHTRVGTVGQIQEEFERARLRFRKDSPNIGISVSELPAEADALARRCSDGSSINRLRAISLSFENALLEERRRRFTSRYGLEPDAEPESPSQAGSASASTRTVVPECTGQLERIMEENSRIKQEIMSGMPGFQPPRSESNSHGDIDPALAMMRVSLDHCHERRRKIQAGYENQIAILMTQLRETRNVADELEARPKPDIPTSATKIPTSSASGLGGNGGSTFANSTYENLQTRLLAAKEVQSDLELQARSLRKFKDIIADTLTEGPLAQVAAIPDNADARSLVDQSREYQAELDSLRKKIANAHEKGTHQQQDLRERVQRLYDEIDEVQQVRQDERVRWESEIWELQMEREVARSRVDESSVEFRKLRAKAESLSGQNSAILRPSSDGECPFIQPSSAPKLDSISCKTEEHANEAEGFSNQDSTMKPKETADYSVAQPSPLSELDSIAREREELAKELEQLNSLEESRQAVASMGKEQEALVHRISVISSQTRLVGNMPSLSVLSGPSSSQDWGLNGAENPNIRPSGAEKTADVHMRNSAHPGVPHLSSPAVQAM